MNQLEPTEAMSSRRIAAGLSALVVAVAVGAFAWALWSGGGIRRGPAGFVDGALVVAWGLPASRLVAEVAAVLTLGSVLGALVFSPRGDTGGLSPVGSRHARVAAIAALVWAVASAGQLLFVSADLMGRPVTGLSATLLMNTAWYVAQGRALLIAVAAALVVFGSAWLASRPSPLVVALAAAVAGVVPVAFAGHAATSVDHNSATTSLAAHILFASIWVGGLGALLMHARWHRDGLRVAAARFSRLALVCAAAVAATGLLNASLRVASIDNLAGSGYGLLLQLKFAALVALTAIGWWHRQHTLPGLGATGTGRKAVAARGAFVRFATVEVVLMAATVGLAVGLSRSRPPATVRGEFSFSGALLGFPMPPAPTAASLVLDWRPDLLFGTACLVAAGLYLVGVRKLRRDGVPWPLVRTVSWLGGVAVVLVATSSGLARYAPVLFSVHMFAHMLTAMLAPILLALGAPITLALRALPTHRDPRYPGIRAWLIAAVHSRPARVLTHPAVAAALWIGGLYVMYFTGAYEYALRNHPAHLAMYAHFIASGYLFFAILISPDPLPRRLGYPARMAVLLGALVFHAFFGVVLMNGTTVIAADWFADIARPWGPDPLTDQKTGGGIAWAIGEAPAILVAFILFRQWIRADEREQRRLDRAADRDGDTKLAAYNEWLADQARR